MGSLRNVRIFACAAILALTSAGFAQKSAGSYKGNGTSPVTWNINSHQTLIWGSDPYLPIGLEIDGTPGAVEAAKSSGIDDVIVDLPATSEGWSGTLAALERLHMRYLIRISSLAPMSTGMVVDPASYRITDAKDTEHLDVSLPGASEALVVTAQKRDGSIIKWANIPVQNDHLIYDVTIPRSLEAVVLVYPTAASLAEPDFWEGLDSQRDNLLHTLKTNPTGPGLRGFVNPIGKTLTLPNRDLRIVPESPAFRNELATLLEIKYRNVVGALRAWGLPTAVVSANETGEDKNAILSFEDIARFVPLWSGSRGIDQIYDPQRKLLYSVDNLHSSIWKDIANAVSGAEAKRYQRLVSAIREIDDVPVVQEWEGWAVPYEGGVASVDGVGMKAQGTSTSAIVNTAAKATSSDLRWANPGWLPATDISVDSADAASQITGITDDLISVGARGIFYHAKAADTQKAIAAEASRRKGDTSPSQGSPSPIFYPENATNPAQAQKLPGGFWWLPAPYDGDRIDYGEGFFGYRMITPKGESLTLWANRSERVVLRMANTKNLVASDVGTLKPEMKIVKNGVEINLSESPIVLTGLSEIPVPEPAYDQTMTEIFVLFDVAKSRHRDLTEAEMSLANVKQGFERNPGGTYVQIRKLLHQLDSFLGRFTWAEAETTEDTNFSEVAEYPGCSNNRILRLHPLINSPTGFHAFYDVPIHTAEDQEVWLAARINPVDWGRVTVEISGQQLAIATPPVGLYGSGFGWYHLGTTKNEDNSLARVKVIVVGGQPDIDTDAILLAPAGFSPNGLAYPEISVDTSKQKTKPPKAGKRQRGTQN